MNPQDTQQNNQTNQQVPPQNSEQTPPSSGPSNNSAIAIFAYLGILIVIPLIVNTNNNPFIKFHVKQGLVLIISFIIGMIIGIVPFLGWIIGAILTIFNLVMVILGIINAATGVQKQLPIIGHYADRFNF